MINPKTKETIISIILLLVLVIVSLILIFQPFGELKPDHFGILMIILLFDLIFIVSRDN